jgi:hypothetical protein
LLVQPWQGQCQLGQSLLSGIEWQFSGGYGSLVRNCRKIEEHAALGLATGRSNYGLLLEWWGKYFNVGQAKELEAELERLPKCDNDERWGFIRAKLGV